MCCRSSRFVLGILVGALAAGCALAAFDLVAPVRTAAAFENKEAPQMLCHNVFFSLKNDTPESRATLVAACKKYLVNHPGVEYFACGTPSDLNRPVNDRDFSVGLLVVFADRASHDQYQTSADHLKFIEENRDTWAKVRVFDADVDVVPVK